MSETLPPPLEINCCKVKVQLDCGDDLLLLDCREQGEYDLVHIGGSSLLPMSSLKEQCHRLEPYRDRQIVVYCHLGARSLTVTNWLREQGFLLAQSMTGGIDAWSVMVDKSLLRY